jgi:hypothetical protein
MDAGTRRMIGLIFICVVFLVLIVMVWWNLEKMNKSLIRDTAIETAASYIDIIESFRSLYTSEVVGNVPKDHVTVTHNYNDLENAIPLPATLTIKLAEQVTRPGSGFSIALFSEYPFPWRKRTLDSFEKRALDTINTKPSESYIEWVIKDGREILRYARADLMREPCVPCHNTHPDSPKIDWKVGDVRGILSVTLPVDRPKTESTGILKDLLLAVLLIGIIIFVVVSFLLRE